MLDRVTEAAESFGKAKDVFSYEYGLTHPRTSIAVRNLSRIRQRRLGRVLDLVSVRNCGRERVCVAVSEFALAWALRDDDGGLQQTFRSSSSLGSLPRALPLWRAERIRKRKKAKRVARRERRKSDCLGHYLYQIAPTEFLGGAQQSQTDCAWCVCT